MIRSTHTYAILEISTPAFEEIRLKLEAAGYQEQFHENDGRLVIDMHGIGIAGPSSAGIPNVLNQRIATLGPAGEPNARVKVTIVSLHKRNGFYVCRTEDGQLLEVHENKLKPC
jgi:hypothetical protein